MNNADRQRIASLLFPKQERGTGGARSVVAAGSSSEGKVQIVIGEPEYDEFGNEVVSIADLTVEVPIIGTAQEGDDVLIQIINGNPTAIGAAGMGDALVGTVTQLESSFQGVQVNLTNLQEALSATDVWVRTDGNNGVYIGKDGSPFCVLITNDRMSFFGEGGKEVAFVSNRQLYIGEARIQGNAQFGNFAFETRETDGSMYLAWVGDPPPQGGNS